ncbi:hypothetical protein SAMN05421824_1423 [Hyunsoonleella jejuensis]|uniref:Cardiolipin synthetase n=1 Tax=Hyunsoonleella jejuensis TaxID=419940 RepID=A0A1H9FAP2_9FLAO|nr:hypothetical protein [Hyunsoonleella jejuensis]SEQ34990.1 hypothetical protein SAMN05421824_1423 [Hyunsoonleella jejuensis]
MKVISITLVCLLLFSCSSAELVDYWKNPDILSYSPNKVLLVGMTSNLEARQKFEKQLQDELALRGITSVMSLNFFEPTFVVEKKTEEELKSLEAKLINDGFDTILFTKVIGVEDKIQYKKDFDDFDATYKKFNEDYLKHQDAYYNPDYYEEYTVYHTETSMYCICPTKDKELIWKGYIDIMDPQNVVESVNDYVRLVIVVLEEQQLISPMFLEHNLNENAI